MKKCLKILHWILVVSYTISFYLLGLILYLLSKLIRMTGFYLMLSPQSAKSEMSGFWHIYTNMGDMLPKK